MQGEMMSYTCCPWRKQVLHLQDSWRARPRGTVNSWLQWCALRAVVCLFSGSLFRRVVTSHRCKPFPTPHLSTQFCTTYFRNPNFQANVPYFLYYKSPTCSSFLCYNSVRVSASPTGSYPVYCNFLYVRASILISSDNIGRYSEMIGNPVLHSWYPRFEPRSRDAFLTFLTTEFFRNSVVSFKVPKHLTGMLN
jgi:hypothetical protein